MITADPKKAYVRLRQYWTQERVRELSEKNLQRRIQRHPETKQFTTQGNTREITED
ncbi:hypothetical protein [Ferrovum sp.]|uniref:hypothetical protein n=1 Tax=Ferrovum sp. TaxID=2609467 RepID=UPI00261D975A|nr:hypothetical protein [Ferrovum sp.]